MKCPNSMRIVSGILAVAVVVLGVLYGMEGGKLNTTNQNMILTEEQLAIEKEYATELQVEIIVANEQARRLTSDLAAANVEITDLDNGLIAANMEITDLDNGLIAANTEVVEANAKVANLTNDLAAANVEITDLDNGLIAANTEVVEANAKVANLTNDLAAANVEISNSLTATGYFESEAELRAWATAYQSPYTNDQYESYRDACEVQQEAMADGYLISVDCGADGWAMLVAVVGNNIYVWWPDDVSTLYVWDTMYN